MRGKFIRSEIVRARQHRDRVCICGDDGVLRFRWLFLLLVSENDAFCCCSSALAGQRNCGHFTCHFHDSIGNYPLLKWRAQMNDIEAGELET